MPPRRARTGISGSTSGPTPRSRWASCTCWCGTGSSIVRTSRAPRSGSIGSSVTCCRGSRPSGRPRSPGSRRPTSRSSRSSTAGHARRSFVWARGCRGPCRADRRSARCRSSPVSSAPTPGRCAAATRSERRRGGPDHLLRPPRQRALVAGPDRPDAPAAVHQPLDGPDPLDEALAARIRQSLGQQTKVEERKMFGCIAFLVGGHADRDYNDANP